ncbi:MAG: nicotinate phosphoribosyltransferase [Candidatus Bipolaricaulota bacterium]
MFNIASEKDIKAGKVTDVYFERTKEILERKDINKRVKMEIRTKSVPGDAPGVFTGLDEVLDLLEGTDTSVWSLPEGSLFAPYDPVMTIEGHYREFSTLETPLLGFLCQASGIATKARVVKNAAAGKPVFHFGSRRMHPAISPMIGRSAYIGGCDGVAVSKTAKMLGTDPVGTIPHALILLLEDSTTATGMFEEIFGGSVDTVALVDTFGDEKFEALENADLIEGLNAVRLDTPSSRRGDMLQIAKEVRWELDLHGFADVRIFISGGLDEESIPSLNEVADAYGVGTSISNSPVVDYSLDIVEIDGEPTAKRGKCSGAKQLFVCDSCGERRIASWEVEEVSCPKCEKSMDKKLVKVIEEGEVIAGDREPKEIRDYSLNQTLTTPKTT